MKLREKQGFTLVELMVVLGILALASAGAGASLKEYLNRAQSARNCAGAHLVYQVAEAQLSALKADGQLEAWLEEAREEGTAADGSQCLLFWDQGESTGAAWALLQGCLTPEQQQAAICLCLDARTGHLAAVYYDATAQSIRPASMEAEPTGCWKSPSLPEPVPEAPQPQEVLLRSTATPEVAAQ